MGRLRSKIYIQMATNQKFTNEIIAQIAAVAAKTVGQAILKERRDPDKITRCRGYITGVEMQAR